MLSERSKRLEREARQARRAVGAGGGLIEPGSEKAKVFITDCEFRQMLPQSIEYLAELQSGCVKDFEKFSRFFRSMFCYPVMQPDFEDERFVEAFCSFLPKIRLDQSAVNYLWAVANLFYHSAPNPPASFISDVGSNIISNASQPLTQENILVLSPLIVILSNIQCKLDESFCQQPIINALIPIAGSSPALNANLIQLCAEITQKQMDSDLRAVLLLLLRPLAASPPSEAVCDLVISIFRVCSFIEASDFFDYEGSWIIQELRKFWGFSMQVDSNIIDFASLHLSGKARKDLLSEHGYELICRFTEVDDPSISPSAFFLVPILLQSDECQIPFSDALKRSSLQIFRGSYPTKTEAAKCLSELIKTDPSSVAESFESPDEGAPDELNYAKAISIALGIDNSDMNLAVIDALSVLGNYFFKMDKIHEFREGMALFGIDDLASTLTQSECKDLSDTAELFYYTFVTGVIPIPDD